MPRPLGKPSVALGYHRSVTTSAKEKPHEVSGVLVRFNQLACFIRDANHSHAAQWGRIHFCGLLFDL